MHICKFYIQYQQNIPKVVHIFCKEGEICIEFVCTYIVKYLQCKFPLLLLSAVDLSLPFSVLNRIKCSFPSGKLCSAARRFNLKRDNQTRVSSTFLRFTLFSRYPMLTGTVSRDFVCVDFTYSSNSSSWSYPGKI